MNRYTHCWDLKFVLKYFDHVHTTVHLDDMGCAQCSVRSVPFSDLRSAEHLFESVRGLFQSVIRLYYRLAFFCSGVAIGIRCYIRYFLICSSWLWACAVLFH